VYLCEKGPGNLPFEEYEGTRTVIKDIKQIESAPNAKDKKCTAWTKKPASQYGNVNQNAKSWDPGCAKEMKTQKN
jgi:hypothetical protein